MITLWMRGLLRRRPGRLIAAAAGIAVAVALLASLGAFLAHSQATMTDRAVRGVGIDWQVQVQPGTDPTTITDTVHGTGYRASPGAPPWDSAPAAACPPPPSPPRPVAAPKPPVPPWFSGYPTTTGHCSPPRSAPWPARTPVSCSPSRPPRTCTPPRATPSPSTAPDSHPVTVTVAGVVDLPQADSLFQKIGAPVGAQRTAPPDNVLLLPTQTWQQIFDPLAAARPDLVSTQIHVQLDHQLPADPAAAYTDVTAAAHNFEAATTGGAIVGNNLGAALDAARADAAYAQVLFLFLGLPGAVLAALLTATIASSGAARRRSEQALLRARGAIRHPTHPARRRRGRRHRTRRGHLRVGRRRPGRSDRLRHRQFRHHRRSGDRLGRGRLRGRPGHRRRDHPAAGPAGPAPGHRHLRAGHRRGVAVPGVGPLRPRRDPAHPRRPGVHRHQRQQLPTRPRPRGGPHHRGVLLGARRTRPVVDRRRPAHLAGRRPAPRPRPAGPAVGAATR